jgi:hypothetical protein
MWWILLYPILRRGQFNTVIAPDDEDGLVQLFQFILFFILQLVINKIKGQVIITCSAALVSLRLAPLDFAHP